MGSEDRNGLLIAMGLGGCDVMVARVDASEAAVCAFV